VPAASTNHPISAGFATSKVNSGSSRITSIPVPTHLVNIAVHIVKSRRVGRFCRDGLGFIIASRVIAVGAEPGHRFHKRPRTWRGDIGTAVSGRIIRLHHAERSRRPRPAEIFPFPLRGKPISVCIPVAIERPRGVVRRSNGCRESRVRVVAACQTSLEGEQVGKQHRFIPSHAL